MAHCGHTTCALSRLVFFFDHVAPNPHPQLPPKNLVGWPAFTVQGVVKSEFVDAMDAQASLLRFRPRSQNDGSERSEGECTPQVGLTSGSEGMREAQAYGIRFAGARRTLVCTRGLFFFFDHVAPNPHTLLPPKNLVGWPAFTVQGVVK